MTSATGRKVAVVTGGSGGVGRATVQAFAEAGYDVAVLARGQAGLDGAVKDVEAAGGRGLGIPTDVADPGAVQRAAEQAEAELGEIDVWVNVAFTGSLAFSWDTSDEEFRRMTEVTYYGQVYGTQAALRHMRPRDRGVIINVGSALAYRSIPLQSAYCGAKHAVVGYTQSVVTELASEKSNVRLCTVQLPGPEHPAVQLEPQQDGRPPDAGRADLPAGTAREGDRLPRRAPAPQHVGRHLHRLHHPRRADRTEAARPLPRPDRREVAAERPRTCRGGARTCSSPRTPTPTVAHTAPSTIRRTHGTRGCGPRCTAPRWPAAC